jgi:hypothetical protein
MENTPIANVMGVSVHTLPDSTTFFIVFNSEPLGNMFARTLSSVEF